jgi:hypothetical protein
LGVRGISIVLGMRGVKGIVGAVVTFNHGLEFGIIFLVSDHPTHEKSFARKKSLLLLYNLFYNIRFACIKR